ncbi:hypothetical protein ACFQ07_10475, partial [Actinomadura adrarensis]
MTGVHATSAAAAGPTKIHAMTETTRIAETIRIPAAPASEAVAHFAARLAFETDVSDVAADLESARLESG